MIFFFLIYLFYLFIYLFLAVLGLRCCAQAFSSCGKRGLLFVAVRGLFSAVASLVAEHGLQAHGLSSCGSRALERRLSSCGSRAQLLRGMWDLPRPGLEPVSLALADGFSTTAPPGKSQFLKYFNSLAFILPSERGYKLVVWAGLDVQFALLVQWGYWVPPKTLFEPSPVNVAWLPDGTLQMLSSSDESYWIGWAYRTWGMWTRKTQSSD